MVTQAQDVLDPTDMDIKLAAEAKAEHESEKSDKRKPYEKAFEADYPDAKQPVKEESEPVEKQPEESKAEPVKEDEKKVEDKAPEDKKTEEPKIIQEDEVSQYALKNGITTLEAKEEIEKLNAIVEKYKEPRELAKALRSTQSGYDKLRNEYQQVQQELESERSAPKVNVSPELEVKAYVEQNQAQIIDTYRQKFPAKTRDMEDDAILEEVSEKLLVGYQQFQMQKANETKTFAAKRREELLSTLKESDKQFLPDVKAILDRTNDQLILSKSFNLNDIVYWAKGQRFDEEIKKAEERAMKRATEQPRIIGELPKSSSSAPSKPKSPSVNISAYDKNRALEMYEGTTMTDEEKINAFLELKKSKK